MRQWRRLKHSVAAPVAVPRPWRWGLLSVLLALTAGALYLVGVAVAAGTALPGARFVPGWLDAPLSRPGGWQGPGAAVLGLIALFALRRALFARLARKPGPVEIVAFGGDAENGPRDEVLADFRRVLTGMSITTPLSVPTDQPADNLLDDVRTALDDTTNSIATAAALARAFVQIRHAYRVSAQLRRRDGERPFGITVHVVVRPAGAGETATFWADDWTEVAEQAAHFVGAFVLPRSRLSRRPPWTAWRGLEVPPRLFHLSQTAYRLLGERRYEESLRAFHDALKIDPANPYLRIGLGQVQEQLGLYLDALATYADVVAVESWYDRRLWRRLRLLLRDDTVGVPPSVVTHSPNGRDALLIARYRLVSRLASAEQLSDQWRRGGPHAGTGPDQVRNKRRQAERAALRSRLTVWLTSYQRLYLQVLDHPDRIERLVDAAAPDLVNLDDLPPADLTHFLQFVAYCEAMHLVYDYRWASCRRVPGMPVTQTALNIMRVWAPLFLEYAAVRRGDSDVAWPPSVAALDTRLQLYLRRKPAWAREWQEYYNAACTFAVALGPSGLVSADPALVVKERKKLAMHAVRHLERAVSSADSGYVGSYAQWLSTGDQDLNDLRSTEYFVDFLDRYLPNEQSRQRRPRKDLLRLIMSLHVPKLLASYAARRADFWQSCIEPDADFATIMSELDREGEVLAVTTEFVRNDRDWLSRVEFIDEAHEFSRRHGLPMFTAAFPSFQDDPMIREQARMGRTPDGVAVVRDGSGIRVSGTYPDDFVRAVVEWRERQWVDLVETFEQAIGPTFTRDSVFSVLNDGVLRSLEFWDDIAFQVAEVLQPGTGVRRQAHRGTITLIRLARWHDRFRYATTPASSTDG